MIDALTESMTSHDADSIIKVFTTPGFQNLVKAINADLAVAEVKMAAEMTKQSHQSLMSGTVPPAAKEFLITAGRLKVALDVIEEYSARQSEEFLEVDLRIT